MIGAMARSQRQTSRWLLTGCRTVPLALSMRRNQPECLGMSRS